MTIAANKMTIWLLAGMAVLFVLAANWHLVHVASTSQPECVAHLKIGDVPNQPGKFSAAGSAC